MLKPIEGQPPATFQSTFTTIVKKLIPVESILRELLHVVVCKQKEYVSYKYWDTPAVTSMINEYAPEGFSSNQQDLYYLIKAIRTFPNFTPEQDRQWRQYSIEICDLINMISLYPDVSWHLLDFLNTNKINVSVKDFFNMAQPLSKTTYSHFIDRATCLVGFLWLTLFLNHVRSLNAS